jgi:hypothetical protein
MRDPPSKTHEDQACGRPCASHFFVNSILTRHVYGSGTHMKISPSIDLGSNFVQGWFNLPDELKIRELEFILVEDH